MAKRKLEETAEGCLEGRVGGGGAGGGEKEESVE